MRRHACFSLQCVRSACATGSRFQQHLARETNPDDAAQLAVFAINPTSRAWQHEAITAGVLPRLGTAEMVATCEALGLPWAGYLPAALLLRAAAESSPPLLPPSLLGQLSVGAETDGGPPRPTVLHVRSVSELDALRRCILAADADDVEGAVPVCEDATGRPLALVRREGALR